MRVLCVICARSGSKGIKNKNLLNFFGKPLILHTLEQAKKIKKFTNIVVSTDSKKISKVVGKDYAWFLRSKSLSGDKIPGCPQPFRCAKTHLGEIRYNKPR